jgi:hypothetical protein
LEYEKPASRKTIQPADGPTQKSSCKTFLVILFMLQNFVFATPRQARERQSRLGGATVAEVINNTTWKISLFTTSTYYPKNAAPHHTA